jgi:glycosyltransferase involved in cell wall biosynthesis
MRFAVIPTRDRPDDLIRCVESIHDQVDYVIVVDNNDDDGTVSPYGEFMRVGGLEVYRLPRPMQPPNLSWLWNEGIREARNWYGPGHSHEAWVAVLNDDAVVPPGWFDMVEMAMKATGAVAGCSGGTGGQGVRNGWHFTTNPISDVSLRLQGWAFLLGPSDLMADERLQWWFGDTDIDMRARASGGTVIVNGLHVANNRANSTTVGVLAEQAGRDRATYESIHGPITWWPGG